MFDLFTTSLEQVSEADVRLFLGLDRPEHQRPVEGAHLDFKSEVDDSISKAVAAFSNSTGGLLLVGVDEDQSRPIGMGGVDAPKQSDLLTQIASKILASIDPRPRFEVHPVPLQESGKFIVLIRVQEGDDPPYFMRDAVFVRELDACKRATRADLIGMVERRKGSEAAAVGRPFPGGNLIPFPFPPEWRDDKFYIGLWARSLRGVAVELDAVREEALIKTIAAVCTNARLNVVLKAIDRDADYVELSSEGGIRGNWRFGSDGSLGFAAMPRRVGGERVRG